MIQQDMRAKPSTTNLPSCCLKPTTFPSHSPARSITRWHVNMLMQLSQPLSWQARTRMQKQLGKNGCGATHYKIHTKSRHGFMYVSHATCLFVCLFPWLLYIQSFQASLSKAHTKNKKPSTSPLYSQKTAKMTCSKPCTQLTQHLSKGHSHDRVLS